MKYSNEIIKIDQRWLIYTRKRKRRQENMQILAFALGLLAIGFLMLYYIPILIFKAFI